MSTYRGKAIELEIYGASHAHEIGMQLKGIDAGKRIDMGELALLMARRAPGQMHTTPRTEADEIIVVSGLSEVALEGEAALADTTRRPVMETTGQLIELKILNTNVRAQDYRSALEAPRPSHADLGEFYKTGEAPLSGGGKHSGRMTALLTAAGGIAMQILKAEHGIEFDSGFESIGDVEIGQEELDSRGLSKDAVALIKRLRAEGDSTGGVIKACALNLPRGIGGPLFDGLESSIAALIYAIPAVKSLEIGEGKALSAMQGFEANDAIGAGEDGVPTPLSNKSGGLLGGITTGLPLTIKVAFKPTPSISKAQQSATYKGAIPTTTSTKGRHDPCIALRARPVVEAALALAIYDHMKGEEDDR